MTTATAPKEFTNPEFESKLVEVRNLESQKHHQNDMYSKPLQNKRKDAVCEIMKANISGKTFLDVGCAEGLYCNYALEYGAKSATGIDVVSKKVEIARKQFPDCEFVVGDVLDLSLEKSFDIVLCSEVLQHLVNYKKCITGMANILSEDGMLIITTPNLAGGDAHEFANIEHTAAPADLFKEIGGASFGKQNAIWKFNTQHFAEDIAEENNLVLKDFVKIGAEPLPHQTKEQAENIFTVITFIKQS